jgi:hypothetical protein
MEVPHPRLAGRHGELEIKGPHNYIIAGPRERPNLAGVRPLFDAMNLTGSDP